MKENEVKITSGFICSFCGTDNDDYREEIHQKRNEIYKVACEWTEDKQCTLEDTPESMEERILKIQTWYLENQIALSPERNELFVNKILDFITQELARQREEIINLIKEK